MSDSADKHLEKQYITNFYLRTFHGTVMICYAVMPISFVDRQLVKQTTKLIVIVIALLPYWWDLCKTVCKITNKALALVFGKLLFNHLHKMKPTAVFFFQISTA